jgi:hypothetical protein
MPEMQPSTPTTGAMPVVIESASYGFEDSDYALGCECADPALQIERWGQDASAAPDAS